MHPIINRRDLDFLLYELLDAEDLCRRPRFAEHDRATFDAVIDAALAIAAEKFLPHAAAVDAQEPEFDGAQVRILPAVREALDALREGGFMAVPFDAEDGGMQLPWLIHQACGALFSSANIGTAGYPLLTVGAANLLKAFGSEALKARYLRPMLEGRYFGTMCLSEPQAGSSLADIRTRAEPTDEGHYLITGSKMWISGGDHELAENIVHMVLAKIPGGPPGVKGISLFLVPRIRIEDDGSLGPRNDVALAGINHKMGYRGTVNTLLSLGEHGDCRGWLLGEPHEGLKAMFQMMNEARIGVGLGATMLGYAGYLHALEYARGRPQGRAITDRDPTSPMVPIIRHADVRRMLLTQKAYVEGALALVLYCSRLLDELHTCRDPAERDALHLLLELLTPVAKSWPSEFCLEANKLAIQVLGGYGYTRDYPVERLYRDNRLNAIHEGTHGIQGLDLLGRKVSMQGGRALALLSARVHETIAEAETSVQLSAHAAVLRESCHELADVTRRLVEATGRHPELGLANATLYLDAFGHVVVAWLWLRQALVALHAQADAGEADQDFYAGKLAACRFFFIYELPKARERLQLLARLDDTTLAMAEASF